MKGRPGASLPAADFEATAATIEKKLGFKPASRDVVSHILYPRVFEDYARHRASYSDVSVLPTHVFLYGQEPGEEVAVEIESGKTLIIRLLTVGDPHPDGRRTVFFELNGLPRDVTVVDRKLQPKESTRVKADPADASQVASPMPGMVVSVAVEAGASVVKGQKLVTMEAMKMESTVYAEQEGKIAEVLVRAGSQVETGDLLVRFA